MSVTISNSYLALQASTMLQADPADFTPASQRDGAGNYSNRIRDPAAGMTRSSQLLAQIADASAGLQTANEAVSDMQQLDSALQAAREHLQTMHAAAEQYYDPEGNLDDSEQAALVEEFNEARQALNDLVEATRIHGQNALQENTTLDYALGTYGGSASLETGLDTAAFAAMDLVEDGQAVVDELNASLREVDARRSEVASFEQSTLGRASDDLELVLRRLGGLDRDSDNAETQSTASAMAADSAMSILNDMRTALLAQGNFGQSNILDLLL
jgi:flagellin